MNGCSISTPVDRALKVRTIQAQFPNKFFFQTSDFLIDSDGFDLNQIPRSGIRVLPYNYFQIGTEVFRGGPRDFMTNRLTENSVVKTVASFDLESEDFLNPRPWIWSIIQRPEWVDVKLIPADPVITEQQKLELLRKRYPTSRFKVISEHGYKHAYRKCGCMNEDTEVISFIHETYQLGTTVLKGTNLAREWKQFNFELILQNSGITPPITAVWICERFSLYSETDYLIPEAWGWIGTKKLQGTIEDLLNRNLTDQQISDYLSQINNLVDRLHDQFNIFHNDLHVGNILYDGSPETNDVRLYLIDFEAATDAKTTYSRSSRENDINFLTQSLYEQNRIDYNYANKTFKRV